MEEIVPLEQEDTNCISVKEVKTELENISVSQQGDAGKDPNKISSLLSVFESHRQNRIKIRIKNNDEYVKLDVHPLDTIQTTKLKLELIFGIDNNKQCLVYGNEILQNQATIKECNINNDDDEITLFHSLQSEKILILIQRMHGRIFKLEVEPECTIKTVKTQIEQEEKLPVERQQLFTENGLVMQDGDTINDFPVQTTIFKLAAKVKKEDFISVFVRGCTNFLCLEVGMYETVNDLKRKIQEILMCPPHSLNVTYQGRSLEDDRNLKDYVITKDSVLHVYRQLIGGNDRSTLSVRTSIGQIFVLGMYHDYQETKIGAIKQEMHTLNSSFLPGKQRLFLYDRELDDEKPLEYYFGQYQGTTPHKELKPELDTTPLEETGPELTLDLVVNGYVI